MILLNKSEYYRLLLPLKKVEINHLFAEAVLLGHVSGSVYVDQNVDPTIFYVSHPYGMSLLFGEPGNDEFNTWLLGHALNDSKTRQRHEWLQAYPEKWNYEINSMWNDYLIKPEDNNDCLKEPCIEVNTRVNFKFNKSIYLDFKNNCQIAADNTIRTTPEIFENMQGSVIPGRVWDNVTDFSKQAVAYSVLVGDKVASTAFSAFIINGQLEIGIETTEAFRGKGYALTACLALIDYCLDHDYEPVWGCKLENTASYLLAQKLGFEPTIYWPFYRLHC